jgi:Metal-dependent hydrolases of the beta-lactamase superfamily III
MLVDGGDNQLFARYLASRFRNTSIDKPKEIECILVTHGDADHFVGLPKIQESEKNETPRKRLFIEPKRVYHNGIVKRPGKKGNKTRPEAEMLGATKKVGKELFLVGLEENLLKVSDDEMNQPFKVWKSALVEYNKRSKIEFRRLEIGDDDAFDFFKDEDIKIEVLGPLTTEVAGKPALKFLGDPPKGPRIGHESLETTDLKHAACPRHTPSTATLLSSDSLMEGSAISLPVT